MKVGDEVKSAVPLPGIPAGSVGRVKEIGRLFIVIEMKDGRNGYYSRRQLWPARSDDPNAEDERPQCALGVGNASVPYGSHLCLLPTTKEDRIESGARFIASGIEAGEQCHCLIPAAWHRRLTRQLAALGVDAHRAIEVGSLFLHRRDAIYLRPREFTATAQLERAAKLLAKFGRATSAPIRAFGYSYPGLFRLEDWWEYERRITPLLLHYGVTALCAYDPAGHRINRWPRAQASHPYVLMGGQLHRGMAPS